jgi:TRAP-type C4-dicarboxylate transport system permease small subunit
MIDRAFEKLTWAIERVPAVAFVFAVRLNFANVIGRYAIGRSILGADEVQIYIMVCMAFLGAAVVAWRKQQTTDRRSTFTADNCGVST